jgi:hypothetical protein
MLDRDVGTKCDKTMATWKFYQPALQFTVMDRRLITTLRQKRLRQPDDSNAKGRRAKAADAQGIVGLLQHNRHHSLHATWKGRVQTTLQGQDQAHDQQHIGHCAEP